MFFFLNEEWTDKMDMKMSKLADASIISAIIFIVYYLWCLVDSFFLKI